MGILGLLLYLKGCLRERRVSDYRGKTAAVDTYAWLHKIIKGPSGRDLILGGPNRYRYVSVCISRIAKLQSLGVKVIMVFDGGPLPSKRGQEEMRKRRRDETFAKGKEMLEKGDQAGFKKLVDAIDISPDIAYRLILELKKRGIDYIVAPYEADAQLAYLSRQGIADVIITEDSDLMAFGAKRMLYKLDFPTMVGSQLELDQIPGLKQANFTWFTHCMFLTTCILAGCDYLNQINGIGLKTAQKFIGRVTTFRGFLGELGSKINQVPPDYQQNFMKAFLTFRFQRVYCPRRKACVQLNDFSHLAQPLTELLQQQKSAKGWTQEVMNYQVMQYVQLNPMDFDFLGQKYSDQIAQKIAMADIHPMTLTEFDPHFAESLTYVPMVPIRTNSTITNARQPPPKPGRPKSTSFSQETTGMARFLEEGKQKKFDPFLFQYHSVKNGQSIQMKGSSDEKTELPQLKPVKGGLLLCQEEDSDIEESVVEEQSISSTPIEVSSIGEVVSTHSCKNQLEQIADKLFGQIFSQQYLRSPFSF